MPLLAENGAPAADIVPPDGMRDRFLSRIASEELVNEINGEARPFLLKQLPSSTIGKAQGGEQARHVEPVVSEPESRPFWLLSRSAAAMAFCVIVGIAGFYTGMWRGKHTPQQPTRMQTPSTDGSARNSVLGDSDH